MKKLFISQPMRVNGVRLTDEEILANREKAIVEAREKLGEDVEAIESFIPEQKPEGWNDVWYLGESLVMLSEADVAYFAEGWKDARGCRIEHLAAVEYGIPVIEKRV